MGKLYFQRDKNLPPQPDTQTKQPVDKTNYTISACAEQLQSANHVVNYESCGHLKGFLHI